MIVKGVLFFLIVVTIIYVFIDQKSQNELIDSLQTDINKTKQTIDIKVKKGISSFVSEDVVERIKKDVSDDVDNIVKKQFEISKTEFKKNFSEEEKKAIIKIVKDEVMTDITAILKKDIKPIQTISDENRIKLNKHETIVEEQKVKIDKQALDFTQKVNEVEAKLNKSIDQISTSINVKFSQIDSGSKIAAQQVDSANSTLTSAGNELNDLRLLVEANKKSIDELKETVNSNTNGINANNNKITANTNKITVNTNEISKLKSSNQVANNVIKHGDVITIRSQAHQTHRLQDHGDLYARFQNKNRGQWEQLLVEKCGFPGIGDNQECWK